MLYTQGKYVKSIVLINRNKSFSNKLLNIQETYYSEKTLRNFIKEMDKLWKNCLN